MTQQLTNPYDFPLAAQLYDQLNPPGPDVDLYLEFAKSAGGPLLELGCGTGRCLIPLIQAGFDVVGIDPSEAMLEILGRKLTTEADEVSQRASAMTGNGSRFEIPLRFGMAFMAAGSFAHILHKLEQESLIGNVFRHLRSGGYLLIDLPNPARSRLLAAEHRSTMVGSYRIDQEDIGVNLAEQTISIRRRYLTDDSVVAKVEWSLRYTYRFELEHLLERAGFDVLHMWGDYVKTPYRSASARLLAVAQKPKLGESLQVRYIATAVKQPVS